MEGRMKEYLVEFHGGVMDVPVENMDGRIASFGGLRLFVVYDEESECVARYDGVKETIDLSPLGDPPFIIVTAAKQSKDTPAVWLETEAQGKQGGEIVINDFRPATEERQAELDSRYPRYRSEVNGEPSPEVTQVIH